MFVGEVPLLEYGSAGSDSNQRQPRAIFDLNRELSKLYDVPVEFAGKSVGLATVARALNRGDLFHAQVATLHLQIPDPPPLTRSPPIGNELIDLARQLLASGLLKEDWDPAKHPRWPAGSPGGIGGEFAPSGSDVGDSAAQELDVPVIPAQITIPMPVKPPGPIPLPFRLPLPRDIVPPLGIPDIHPRDVPRNPYPDRPDCVEEWEAAERRCWELLRSGRLGKGDYREHGMFLYQCIMGQVSEDCGGSATGT